MLLPDVLVEMLHVPAQVMRAVFPQHPHQFVHRHPTQRRLAEPAIGFLDQADDAPVADPMFQEANHPFLVDFIEGRGDRLPITAIILIM
jgi:hypothetical protein